jgi:hypothetical protein
MEQSRIPMSAAERLPVPKKFMEEGYHYRWCADYGVDKLARYLQAGYQYVEDGNGDRISRGGGDRLWLMRLPIEYWEQDLKAKHDKVIEINKQTQRDAAPKSGAVPEYLPQGMTSAIERDNL